MTQTWPTADLDPVRRLRVLATAAHAPMFAEELIDLPFDRVWAVASDLEHELPHLVRAMRTFTYTKVEGENIRARAVGVIGNRADFDIVLRPGWCVMQSRFVLGGMAAVAEGDRTRFAVLGGSRLPGAARSRALLGHAGLALGHGMIGRLRRRLTSHTR
ncbi:hypothetical protein SAMN05421504_1011487 [Amycolatopsis xylanica]|uniref:Polyketide cyclase / dehydrase and lipid transport n=1 Tax=Amycolatopsis xylanica TaxID=589385 RepID=A0A1H2WBM5_9PSEU|nr:hypothetical protein [Amycolatopsis xylanica]SDW78083.1 hypothetical protein SAMN05421504_1011487 [Amycolatopsis xylanica]